MTVSIQPLQDPWEPDLQSLSDGLKETMSRLVDRKVLHDFAQPVVWSVAGFRMTKQGLCTLVSKDGQHIYKMRSGPHIPRRMVRVRAKQSLHCTIIAELSIKPVQPCNYIELRIERNPMV